MNQCNAVKYHQIEERAIDVAHYIIENNANNTLCAQKLETQPIERAEFGIRENQV